MQTGGRLSQLDSLAANLADITSFVKCPICFQLLKNPVELRCNHMFCVSCIERHAKGNNYNCPVCKATALKRSVQPAHETEGALKLIENVCKKFKEATAPKGIKKNASVSNPEKIAPTKKGKVKQKAPAVVKNVTKTPIEVIAKTTDPRPKRVAQKAKKIEEKLEVLIKPETKQNKTKYEHNKKLVVQIAAPYKESVMKWLTNSQNMFERPTQTQQAVVSDLVAAGSSKLSRNLKSVSQRVAQRRTLPARQAADRKDLRMCRSMESLQDKPTGATVAGKTKAGKLKVDIRIFDTPVDDSEVEEKRIENIDSNPHPGPTKSAICRMVEEECLETMVKNAARRKSSRKRKKPDEKSKDELEGLDKSMRSDWQRIAKISHNVDRVEGIPKKLKLVTTPGGTVLNCKDRDKENPNVIDTQFSTTVASEYGRVLNEFEQNVNASKATTAKCKAKASLTVHKVTLNEIMKEIEVSKRKKCITEQLSNDTTSVNIDYNEQHHKTPPPTLAKHADDQADNALFLQSTQTIGEEIIEETPAQDDIFSYATQPTMNGTHPNEEALHTQCEEFLTQFNELSNRLSTFVNLNSFNYGLDDSYSKLVLVHKHLQTLQPKFSNMSLILSRNEGTTTVQEILADQSTQTEQNAVTTSKDVHCQTLSPSCNVMKTEKCLSPIVFDVMTEQAVQTSPLLLQPPTPRKLSVVPEEVTMKDTLDFVDFDTQAAIIQSEAKRKMETLTNRYTEQIQLTAFIEGVQMNDEEPVECSESKGDATTSLERSARRKLYKSPLSLSQSPIGVSNKRIKPLAISDSEEEDGGPIFNKFIREDISVCFDSESQVGQNDMNSPNVDKYLDDVWSRLQSQLETSDKVSKHEPEREDPMSSKNALQMAIKANTQDLIAKCEQLISNPAIESKHPNSQVSKVERIGKESPKRKPKGCTISNPAISTVSSANLMTDSIFGDVEDEIFENFATPSPCTSSRDKPKSTLHNLHSDLIYKDSNSSILTNILDDNPLQITAIKVLQDVQISKPVIPDAPLKPAVHTFSDDELIFSTPETTPTKPRRAESPCEAIVLAPPPDFQDDQFDHHGDLQAAEEKHHSNILSVTQRPINLSPIPLNVSRSRHIFNTAIPRSLPHHAKVTPISGEPFRRVTSTPYSKAIPNFKTKPVNSPLCHPIRQHRNQMAITNYLRKEGGGASSLNSSGDDDLFVRSASKKSQAVVACTRLDKTQMIAINALAKRGLVRYSSAFDASVTHMVVATNDANCAKDHTIKYVRAVAAGIWVVNCKWVQDSLLQKNLLPEEFYEVHDVSGQDGPKQSRLYRSTKPLFDRFKIYVAPQFELITPAEVEDIITSLGGVAVSSPQALLPKEDYICVIITETGATQDEEYIKYQDWAEKLRVATVDFEWLTRSIGAYKLNSLRRFALCTDEILCELGYPEPLLETAQFSYSQND